MIAFCVNVTGQENNLIGFKITAVNLGITTPARVSCIDFENSFSTNSYDTMVVVNQKQVSALEGILKRSQIAKANSREINVRAKIYLNYGQPNTQRVLCVDKFYDISLDGKLLNKNKGLINFLKTYLKRFE